MEAFRAENPPLATVNTHLSEGLNSLRESNLGVPSVAVGTRETADERQQWRRQGAEIELRIRKRGPENRRGMIEHLLQGGCTDQRGVWKVIRHPVPGQGHLQPGNPRRGDESRR